MLKENYLTGNYVYYAEGRLNRPNSTGLVKEQPRDKTEDRSRCPFCPENGYMTPPSVFDNGIIKIVPNLYPFISEKEGLGYHEVVIDTPDHFEDISDFSREHMLILLKALKERTETLEEKNHIKYVQVFKNNGPNAGASQRHSHWQIGAQTIIPPKQAYMLKALEKYSLSKGESYFDGEENYISLWENHIFKVVIPTDSMFTFETHIITKKHITALTEMDEEALKALGEALGFQLNIYKQTDPGLSYNICFYSSPKDYRGSKHFRFYEQLIPRKGNMAGFEFSTGCYINSVPPGEFEKMLREAGLPC
ncbi:MAG: DUF4931 domain-containing protein [Clostridiales bacterium]|nr:DUF4931 domain-containing protein [Clostridiales bacterium]